mmetsp:Transcript_25783/g.43830  ORF Transcript_25783/g.43830 Transcript_25783/m.43830 type:complete len:250 (-) Transcript_25783:1201-1950(-)
MKSKMLKSVRSRAVEAKTMSTAMIHHHHHQTSHFVVFAWGDMNPPTFVSRCQLVSIDSIENVSWIGLSGETTQIVRAVVFLSCLRNKSGKSLRVIDWSAGKRIPVAQQISFRPSCAVFARLLVRTKSHLNQPFRQPLEIPHPKWGVSPLETVALLRKLSLFHKAATEPWTKTLLLLLWWKTLAHRPITILLWLKKLAHRLMTLPPWLSLAHRSSLAHRLHMATQLWIGAKMEVTLHNVMLCVRQVGKRD